MYAKLLTGDGVYPRLHPLVADSGNPNKHVAVDHKFSTESLLFPTSNTFETSPEAVFLIEAVVDLASESGLRFANDVISATSALESSMKTGSSSVSVSIAYRVIPSTAQSASLPFACLLANANIVGTENISALLSIEDVASKTAEELVAAIPNLADDKKAELTSLFASSSCVDQAYLAVDLPADNFVAANGRMYAPDSTMISVDDLKLLLELELPQSRAMTKILSQELSFETTLYFDALARSSVLVSLEHNKPEQSKLTRSDMVSNILDFTTQTGLDIDALSFSWNQADVTGGAGSGKLQTQISAVVDPASEAAQRVAPLLLAFRDHFKLPLRLVLAPKSVLSGDEKNVPITSYYRFVADPFTTSKPKATFSNLPTNHVLTVRMDVAESWNIQQSKSLQDSDNLRCEVRSGCGDAAAAAAATSDGDNEDQAVPFHEQQHLTEVEYSLKNLLVFGQCYDAVRKSPPNGLQLTLTKHSKGKPSDSFDSSGSAQSVEVRADGSINPSDGDADDDSDSVNAESVDASDGHYSDTLVMKNVGYWQLRANPGVWDLSIAPGSRGAEIFDMVDGTVKQNRIKLLGKDVKTATKKLFVQDFVGSGELLLVKRRPGTEQMSLFYEDDGESDDTDDSKDGSGASVVKKDKGDNETEEEEEVINVFSLATGHLYERLLKIMMLSVTKRASVKVKFWLFENFLSPNFKATATSMAEKVGFEVAFVTYKWPEWLRGQSEKQRIIWGYKILFLDVLFPLDVKKIIYVDADQVVRGDLKELWDMDLQGAPYGYTPFCTSRESTLGFQFWRGGFWEQHLRGRPYHISALYVVDLEKFRKDLVGDNLRSIYQQLSADPNSLANLDQDLPNYAQHQVPIFSLPQEWLWCESWCSDESKAASKTIDLCNNPLHKENKVAMAKRVISGPLFEESWVELDEEVDQYDKEYFVTAGVSTS